MANRTIKNTESEINEELVAETEEIVRVEMNKKSESK